MEKAINKFNKESVNFVWSENNYEKTLIMSIKAVDYIQK